jgi:hypothetical protein
MFVFTPVTPKGLLTDVSSATTEETKTIAKTSKFRNLFIGQSLV